MSERTLTDHDQQVLDYLPVFYHPDPLVQGHVQATVAEVDRIDEQVDVIIRNMFPDQADEYLEQWERMLGLAQAPEDKTLLQRQTAATAFYRRVRKTSSGLDWKDRISDIVGQAWSYAGPHPNGLRGFLWDDYRGYGLDEAEGPHKPNKQGWVLTHGNNGMLAVSEEGLQFVSASSTFIGHYEQAAYENMRVVLQVRAGSYLAPTGNFFEVTPKRPNAGVPGAQVYYSRGSGAPLLAITVAGQNAQVSAPDMVPGEVYWLVGQIINNDVHGELWDVDPDLGEGAPLVEVDRTLTGGTATTYGEGAVGWPSWNQAATLDQEKRILSFKAAQIGANIDDNVVRVSIPFDPDSGRAFEVEQMLRSVTPAHLELEVFYSEGFVLGESLLGEDPFV